MKEKTEDVIEVQKEKQVDDEKKWCVYMHTSPSGKRYIGITSQKPEDRWGANGSKYLQKNKNGNYNQPAMAKAILKYPWDLWKHEIILSYVSKQYANQIEQELIKHYRSQDPRYGYNITSGGGGMSGFHHKEESKKKMSISKKTIYLGAGNPFYGKHHTEETKMKFSQNRKGKYTKESNHNYGKKPSEATRQRMRENHADVTGINNPRARQVYCIELNEIFDTIVNAKRQTGFSSISACCNGLCQYAGRHPYTGECLHWLYVKDQMKKDGTVIQGAITLGYITEEQVYEYLNNLKQKGNDA